MSIRFKASPNFIDGNLTVSGSVSASSYVGAGGSGETNTASNVGGGTGVFKAKSGVDLEFKTLVGSGVTINSYTSTIGLTSSGGGGTPGGADTEVQFNSGSAFSGSSNLIYNYTNNYLSASGPVTSSGIWPVGQGSYSVAVGRRGTITGLGAIGVGSSPQSTGEDSIAIGYNAVASHSSSVAISPHTDATAQHTIAMGYGAQATGDMAIAIGSGSGANQTDSIAIGRGTYGQEGAGCIAIGYSTSAAGTKALGIGYDAGASGYCIAIGAHVIASVDEGLDGTVSNIAIGSGSTTYGGTTIAIGTKAKSGGTGLLGTLGSIAIGSGSIAYGSDSIAFGTHTSASAANAIAIGYRATGSAANAIAIGSGSVNLTANTMTIGNSVQDMTLNVTGGISASVNISASAYYGDGSNLSGIATSIDYAQVALYAEVFGG